MQDKCDSRSTFIKFDVVFCTCFIWKNHIQTDRVNRKKYGSATLNKSVIF